MAGPFLSKRLGYHKETGAQRIISAVGAGSCPTVPFTQIPKQIRRGESILSCPRRAFHIRFVRAARTARAYPLARPLYPRSSSSAATSSAMTAASRCTQPRVTLLSPR